MTTIHQLELIWIHHLQNALRGPFTDVFFRYWDYVDTVWFVSIFVAAIMYLFNRKEGISLLFIFIISGMVNTLLKLYFNSPRPCHIDPLVSIIFSKSNGFPSGAAQTATIIAGLGLMKCQKNIYKILAVVFALFVYFSRIYLGLHFFTDILGGIVVGIALLIIYKKIFPFIENHWVKFAIGLTALSLVLGGGKIPPQATMTLGIAIGLWFARQPELSSSWSSRILTFLIVIIGSTLFMYLGQTHPSIILLATFLAGLWIVYLGSHLSNWKCEHEKTRNS